MKTVFALVVGVAANEAPVKEHRNLLSLVTSKMRDVCTDC